MLYNPYETSLEEKSDETIWAKEIFDRNWNVSFTWIFLGVAENLDQRSCLSSNMHLSYTI